MPWELNSDRPIFVQIVEKITDDILSGRMQPGDQVPPVRDLAMEASVNPNTMQRALQELEKEGLMFTKRTSGRFITEDVELIRQKKQERAADRVRSFLEEMNSIGMGKEEILELIRQQ